MFCGWPSSLLDLSSIESLEVTRPWAAALLLLPLALLLLSLRRREERTVLLGTARFFSGLAGGGGRSSSRRISASQALAAIALAAASGAAVGPAPPGAEVPGVQWLVVVDRSPSMYLEPSAEGGGSRLASSLRAARVLLEEAGVPTATVRYLDGSTPGAGVGRAFGLEAAPPAALLEQPVSALPEPSWGAFDRPGVLWVTDGVPPIAPASAGWVASGGEAVPGPVGWGPDGALVWDGPGTEPRLDASLRPRAWVGGELDPVLASFAGAWAAERGVALVEERDETSELVVEGAGPLPRRSPDRSGGRDGWTVSFAVDAGAPSGIGRSWWIAAGDGPRHDLISAAPGRVVVAPLRLGASPAPADVFAVSMGALLDGALRSPRWIVPLGERAGAGQAGRSAPRLPAMAAAQLEIAREGRERGQRLATAAFALIAVAFAVAAAIARAREAGPRRS